MGLGFAPSGCAAGLHLVALLTPNHRAHFCLMVDHCWAHPYLMTWVGGSKSTQDGAVLAINAVWSLMSQNQMLLLYQGPLAF